MLLYQSNSKQPSLLKNKVHLECQTSFSSITNCPNHRWFVYHYNYYACVESTIQIGRDDKDLTSEQTHEEPSLISTKSSLRFNQEPTKPQLTSLMNLI